jgi:hypothetical protein
VGWANPVRADGKPDEPLELNAMTATAEDGSFRLGPLPLGEFQITALKEPPRRLGKLMVKANQAGVVITVKPE